MLTDDDCRMLTDAAETLEDADQAIRDATGPGCEPMTMARALRAIVDRPAPHSPPMPGTGAPRDPSRIDPILSRLRAAWHRSPDLRLGQLIVGSIPIGHIDRADAIRRLFNAECHEFGASGAPVEWPAPPAAQPPPVLDLDALVEAERAMAAGLSVEAGSVPLGDTGDYDAYVHIVGRDGRVLVYMNSPEADRSLDLARGIVALRNAAPHLIAEARAAVALRVAVEEREADMHMRIRAGYDKAVADAWRAEVAKRDSEIARLTAELAAARAVSPDVEAAIDARDAEWQNQIATFHEGFDGDGCESGDPIDWTLSALGQAKCTVEDAVGDFIEGHAKRLCDAAGGVWHDEYDSWASQVHDVLNHLRADADGTVIDGRASRPATVGGLLATEADALLCRWYTAKQAAIEAFVDLENLRRPDPDDSWAGGIGRHDPMPGAEKRAADTKERLVAVTNEVIAAMTRGPIVEVPDVR